MPPAVAGCLESQRTAPHDTAGPARNVSLALQSPAGGMVVDGFIIGRGGTAGPLPRFSTKANPVRCPCRPDLTTAPSSLVSNVVARVRCGRTLSRSPLPCHSTARTCIGLSFSVSDPRGTEQGKWARMACTCVDPKTDCLNLTSHRFLAGLYSCTFF